MNNDDDEKSIAGIIKEIVEHNPYHYIKINIFGKKLKACARCLGLWLGLLISFIITIPFWTGIIKIDNFYLIFIISWLLVTPAIIDWTTTNLNLRKGNNKIRIITGFLYGTGIVLYLFVLPASIIFKIGTYLIYEIIFQIIKYNIRFE